MITREDLGPFLFNEKIEKLLAERDEALKWKDAYREVAIKSEKSFRKSIEKVVPYVQHELVVCEVDAEAKRIFEEGK